MSRDETSEQNDLAETHDLSPRQAAALPYLIASPTLTDGARLAHVARATLYRWMEDPYFKQTLKDLRAEAAELAKQELRGLMLKAVQVLAEAMEHSNANIRVKASQAALSIGLKAIDLKDLSDRIDLAGDALSLLRKRRPFP